MTPASVDVIGEIPVRVSVELGRSRMPLARVVGLPPGAVVELDRGSEEPVDLYVNGRRYASGTLLLVDGEWAVRIETVHARVAASSADREDAA